MWRLHKSAKRGPKNVPKLHTTSNSKSTVQITYDLISHTTLLCEGSILLKTYEWFQKPVKWGPEVLNGGRNFKMTPYLDSLGQVIDVYQFWGL